MLTGTAIQLISTFDCSSIGKPLQRQLLDGGMPLEVRVTPPGQIQDHMLSPSRDTEDDIGTIVLVRLEDWLRPAASAGQALTDAVSRQVLRKHIEEFLSHLAVLGLRGRPVWVMVCPSMGWVAEQSKMATLCRTMTNLFAVRARNVGQVEVVPFLTELVRDELCDRDADRLSHDPFTHTGSEKFAAALANQLIASVSARDPNASTVPSGSPELAAFLTGLHVVVRVTPAISSDLPDVSRILRTAASFSLAGENPTLSDAEAADILASGACYVVSVSDRLGDYGASGVVVAKPRGSELVVDSLSLSCTVLGKQVEYALLQALSQVAARENLATVIWRFRPSQRNQATVAFLNAALEMKSENRYLLDVSDVENRIRQSAIAPGKWALEVSPAS